MNKEEKEGNLQISQGKASQEEQRTVQRPRKRRVLNVYEKQRYGAGGKFRAVGGDELREEWEKKSTDKTGSYVTYSLNSFWSYMYIHIYVYI